MHRHHHDAMEEDIGPHLPFFLFLRNPSKCSQKQQQHALEQQPLSLVHSLLTPVTFSSLPSSTFPLLFLSPPQVLARARIAALVLQVTADLHSTAQHTKQIEPTFSSPIRIRHAVCQSLQ